MPSSRGSFGDQLRHQLGVEFGKPRRRRGDFLFGELAHFRIAAHRFGGGEIVAGLRFGGQAHRDRFELRELARQAAEAIVVGDHARIGEQAFEFLATFEQRFEFATQAGEHGKAEGGTQEKKGKTADSGCVRR